MREIVCRDCGRTQKNAGGGLCKACYVAYGRIGGRVSTGTLLRNIARNRRLRASIDVEITALEAEARRLVQAALAEIEENTHVG